MKTILLSILIFLLSTSEALASPLKSIDLDKKNPVALDPQFPGKVEPKLTNDMIEGLLKGRPTFIIGDWNSSGAPEMPYKPDYEFAYQCQAQMSDNLIRGEENASYRLYAVADFTINNQQTSVQTEDLQWFAKKRFAKDKILDTDDAIPFSRKGSRIGLSFRAGAEQNDRTYLYLHLQQKLGSVIVVEDRTSEGLRSYEQLSGFAEMDLRSANGRSVPNLSLKVYCNKEK